VPAQTATPLPLRFWIAAAALVLVGVVVAAYVAGVFN
jgi:hypothetical protein